MPSFFTTAAVLATATLSLAAPADLRKRTHFAIDQVSTGKVFKSGPIAMMKTYNKFAAHGAVAPPDVVRAAAAAVQSGSVAANPEQFDEAYLVPVTVGSSKLNLDFDTGSSDLWVFSTKTPSSESAGHSLYNPSNATIKPGYTWDISYGDGSGASGNVYTDRVVVGPVTATRQAVEAATSVSTTFTQDTDTDGLLGLAMSSINTVKPQSQLTFFDTVKPTLAQKLFTADLKKGAPGSYGFGFIDTSKFTGSITYVPVNTANGFWEFTAGGYSVGSGVATGSSAVGDSIADTGTTLFYLPAAVVKAYYAKTKTGKNDSSQGGYTISCSESLPPFNVNIGGQTFVVPGSYINYTPIDNTGKTCFGGMQANTGIGFNIFGDIFLKSVFAVFDETESAPRLGFAEQ